MENIPFVISTNDDNETFEGDNENENHIIDDPNNSSMEGCFWQEMMDKKKHISFRFLAA